MLKKYRFVGKKQKKENSTTEKADAETKTAAGADAEGRAKLTQLLRVDLRKLPHQTLLLAFISHPSLLLFLFSLGIFYFLVHPPRYRWSLNGLMRGTLKA